MILIRYICTIINLNYKIMKVQITTVNDSMHCFTPGTILDCIQYAKRRDFNDFDHSLYNDIELSETLYKVYEAATGITQILTKDEIKFKNL